MEDVPRSIRLCLVLSLTRLWSIKYFALKSFKTLEVPPFYHISRWQSEIKDKFPTLA